MVLVLAGCAAAPVPATLWLRLPALPPGEAGAPATTAAVPNAAAAPANTPAVPNVAAAPAAPTTPGAMAAPAAPPREVWQLAAPLPMPAHLDRDTLFLPQGAAGALVQPLAGARWVEPLRDALPRLLREDLVRLRGGQPLWTAPLPPGLAPTRVLRVEITVLEIGADGRALALAARWSIAEAGGTRVPVAHEGRWEIAAGTAGTGPAAAEAWALAHRRAIALLAARVAATMAPPAAAS